MPARMGRATPRRAGSVLATTHALRAIAGGLCAVLLACGPPEPEPVVLNVDACDFCRMTISDSRFGGEVIMTTGRVHKFDAIECLAGFVRSAKPGSVRTAYVIDTQHPGTFIAAGSAGFLKGGFLRSPMGRSIVAFATPAAAEEQRAMLGGTPLSWAGVRADSTAPAPGVAR